jgi:DNA-binding MurR/RpiR family transcriptional regulator
MITSRYDSMTRAEKQLANSLLDNYPVSGLGSITTVAEAAKVSTPTVVRMVQKLGFKGFTEFQGRLHNELEETISNPITKHERMAPNAPGAHILNRFAEAVMNNMRQSLGSLDPAEFDAAAKLIGDRKRAIYLAGGRITGAIAEYFFTHLQVIRPGITRISTNSASWPHYVLNMSRGDVLILFDIRRFRASLRFSPAWQPNRARKSCFLPTAGARRSPNMPATRSVSISRRRLRGILPLSRFSLSRP